MKQLKSKSTIWTLITLFVLSAVPLYAASEGQYDAQQGIEQQQQQQQRQQQDHQSQWSQRSQSSVRVGTQTGTLCRANDLVGSDVKSKTSMSSDLSRQSGTTADEQAGAAGADQDAGGNMYNRDRDATDLYGSRQADSSIGTVAELVIDDQKDNVCYVVLESDGQFYPVPWKAFEVHSADKSSALHAQDQTVYGADQSTAETRRSTAQRDTEMTSESAYQRPTLYLNISKQQLRQAPTIQSVSVERLDNSQLKQQIDSFYSQHTKDRMSHQQTGYSQLQQQQLDTARQRQDAMSQRDTQTAQRDRESGQDQSAQTGRTERQTAMGQSNLLKATEVIGLGLQSSTEVDLGSIEDLVIDAREGHIAYGLVSFGGFLNIGEKVAAVPWSSLNIAMPQQVARIDATREKLEAAVVDDQNPLAQLSQPDTARRFHENFDAEPYWGVYGYIPGQAGAASLSAWQADSSFNRKFDPGKVTSIEGTIQSVSTFQPESGAAPGVQLKIETEDGDMMTVYTGPQQYIQQQDISLSSGKQVQVTGSKVDIDGQTVILASRVQADNQTLDLRDSQGKPRWNLQDSRRELDRPSDTGQQSGTRQDSMQHQQQERDNY